MQSFLGVIVGLLQSALSLLGFVQQHPELPQSSRDQVQQIAQQAIKQATNALNNANTQSTATGQSSKNTASNSSSFATPTTGPAPLSVTFNTEGSRAENGSIDFGDGNTIRLLTLFGNGTSDSTGFCGAGPDFFCNVHHDYVNSGTYTALLKDASGNIIGTQTVRVAGVADGVVLVPGMQKYTDSDFWFSFWYPNNWNISVAPGPWTGIIVKQLKSHRRERQMAVRY
jgi:hypothetical protein